MSEEQGLVVADLDKFGRTQVYAQTRSSTYGRFGGKGLAFDAPPNATTQCSYKAPFPVDIADGGIFITSDMAGDIANLTGPTVGLNATVGGLDVLTAAIAVNDKKVTLNPAFLAIFTSNAIIDQGYFEVTIVEGETSEGPYLISDYDLETGDVTLDLDKEWVGATEPDAWSGFENAYTTAAVISVRRMFVYKQEIYGGIQHIRFGDDSAGSAPLPANTLICLEYINNGNASRRVVWNLSLLTGKPSEEE